MKNGRSIEGIINKEDGLNIDLEVGGGTVKFSKDQVESIQRSSAQGVELIKQGWVKEKEAQDARAREIQERQEHGPKQIVIGSQNGQMTV